MRIVTEKNLNGSEKRSLGDRVKDIVYDDAYGEVSLDGGSTPLSSTNLNFKSRGSYVGVLPT